MGISERMGQEIELKLQGREADLNRVPHHPLLVRYAAGPCECRQLISAYYDTPDCQLFSHGMALRVRRKETRFIQTLKTRGTSRDGLAQRGEWEWPLADETLQPALVPVTLWPAALRDAYHCLDIVFRTDFERRAWQLILPSQTLAAGQAAAHVELAVDQGVVSAGAGCEAIAEIELELLRGDATTLTELARIIAGDIPLTPCDVSKAERGYRLLRAQKTP